MSSLHSDNCASLWSAPCDCSEPRTARVEHVIASDGDPAIKVTMTEPQSGTDVEALAEALPFSIDAKHLQRQREWSERTFGPGPRAAGVVDHIRKELTEIEAEPTSLEWIDVVILALDGAWRAGYAAQGILDAIAAKQAKNEARTWPDWRERSENEAIEHDRSVEP